MAEPDHPSALPGETLLLEYRVKSTLGADGFGITYLAYDTVLNKSVAIKEYFPFGLVVRAPDGSVIPASDAEANYQKGLAQFLVEARALARFTHPNIVAVDRCFEANGTAYMLREYEKGESLADRFASARPSESTLKAILAPLLDGLEAVHEAGVLHRDIKPTSIFVRDDGSPVLLDFGTARLASRAAIQDIIPVLTPGYAPIEHYIRSGHQGPWSDIYSLAGVLFWAVTGQHPSDSLSRLRMDNVPKMLGAARAHYSATFLSAIQWGLGVEENYRPQSVAQWRRSVIHGVPAHVADSRAVEARPDATRKYVWVALGVLIFYLFVAGADIVKQRAEHQRMIKLTQKSSRPSVPNAGADAGSPQQAVPGPGGLTREEMVHNLPHLAAKFSEIDTDHSGRVTTEELQAYWRRTSPVPKK